MLYRFLADIVVLAHLAYIAFALCGGLLALRWRWMPWVHLPAAVWGAAVVVFGWLCPLTPLENALRRLGGSDEYPVDFVEHYILPIIYPARMTRDLQVFLGIGMVAVNLALYWVVWRARRGGHVRKSRLG
jgi:hypothetical protein